MFPSPLSCLDEKLNVLRIGSGPATFDIVDAKFVQLFGDAQFVERTKRNAHPLRAIAQGGIIKGDGFFHDKRDKELSCTKN
jgi:hypothetical protein